jgi:AGZA family xanthine/uracil permease-like MFS transporter
MSVPDVSAAVSDIAVAIPGFHVDMLLNGLGDLAPLLATAIPLGVYNFAEAMSNVESAAAAGDSFNLRSVLLADGLGAIIGAGLGSPFPPAVYIGHPGWKASGGRSMYSMASGVFIAVLCFVGLFGLLATVLPTPAIVPILLYIGLLIGAQAFQSVPKIEAAAVVAAILPNLASWGTGLMDNALAAAGTTADQVGEEALTNAGLVYHGLKVLGEGAVLAGMVLGSVVAFLLARRFYASAIAAAVGAVLSWVGLIHAGQVAWAASPQVALGYAMLAVVLVAFAFTRRGADDEAAAVAAAAEAEVATH